MYPKWSGGYCRNRPLISSYVSQAHLIYDDLDRVASVRSPKRVTQAVLTSNVMALVTDEAMVPLR